VASPALVFFVRLFVEVPNAREAWLFAHGGSGGMAPGGQGDPMRLHRLRSLLAECGRLGARVLDSSSMLYGDAKVRRVAGRFLLCTERSITPLRLQGIQGKIIHCGR
jgi:hypothetical protein